MVKKVISLLLSILYSISSPAQADSLKTLLNNETDEKKQIEQLIEIADIYIMIDSDSAFYYCDSAMELILNQKNCTEQHIQVLILKSELYCLNGNFDKAMEYAESTKELAETINNKSLIASAKLSFVNIYIALSFYDVAYQNCLSALQIFKSQNDLAGQRKCFTYLGSLSIGSSMYKEAVDYFAQALSLARQMGNKLLLGCSYSNLGIAYAYQKENNQALLYFNCSLKISEQHNFWILLLHNYLNFASFYKDSKQFKESEECCRKAISIAQSNKNWRTLCVAMNTLGQNKLEQSKYIEGLPYAYKGDSIAKKLSLMNEMTVSSLLISDLYAGIHQNDSALKYYKLYSCCKDSLYSRQNQTNLQKIKFEYQIKEQQALQQQKSIRNGIITTLLILGLLIIITKYILISRNKSRKLKLIECDLDYKKREITSKMMYIRKKNEAIASIAGKLEESKHLFSGKSSPLITHTIKELSTNSQNESWQEFEIRFKEVDPDFFRKLSDRFPRLTPNDKKLCAYLKLNLSTKEIASLLNLSVNSILSARYRLRKKLDLNKADTNINQFLDTL